MSKRSRKGLCNVVVISDTHVGCKVGLCHIDGVSLDDGGTYTPSSMQKKVYRMWETFWGEWVPQVTRGEPFIVVHNGDAIDGVHHGATTQWSHNLTDQCKHAYDLLKPVVEACEGRYYHIRGTEAHVGKAGAEEEKLAKDLGAIPNEIGQYARYDLWLRVHDKLCHFLHHIGTTSSANHETAAINAELTALYAEAGRWREEPPAVVCRSHRHQSGEIKLPAETGDAISFVTAAWQLKTPFTWKISGARNKTPQIGGALIRYGDEELHVRHKVWKIERSKEEKADTSIAYVNGVPAGYTNYYSKKKRCIDESE